MIIKTVLCLFFISISSINCYSSQTIDLDLDFFCGDEFPKRVSNDTFNDINNGINLSNSAYDRSLYYLYRARWYKDSSKLNNSLNDYNKAIEINDTSWLRIERSKINLCLKKYEDAIKDAQKAYSYNDSFKDIAHAVINFANRKLIKNKIKKQYDKITHDDLMINDYYVNNIRWSDYELAVFKDNRLWYSYLEKMKEKWRREQEVKRKSEENLKMLFYIQSVCADECRNSPYTVNTVCYDACVETKFNAYMIGQRKTN